MYQRPIQSVNYFKSYRANKLKSTDRQTDRQTHLRKPFRVQRVSKRGHLTKTGGCHISHKSNTFSDENVKSRKNSNYRTVGLTFFKKIGNVKFFYNIAQFYSNMIYIDF